MIFKGFLLGIGFFLGVITFIAVIAGLIALVMIVHLRTRYVTRNVLERHLAVLTEDENFEEAEVVRQLLERTTGHHRIKLPDHYLVEIAFRTSDEHPFPFAFTRKITLSKKSPGNQEK